MASWHPREAQPGHRVWPQHRAARDKLQRGDGVTKGELGVLPGVARWDRHPMIAASAIAASAAAGMT